MNPRACLLTTLLVLAQPGLSQEPKATQALATAAPTFDLRSAAIQEVIRETAATQFADARVVDDAPSERATTEFEYVPPAPEPARKRAQPAETEIPELPLPPPSTADRVFSGLFDTLLEVMFEELLGTSHHDEVTAANDALRCRVQKETHGSPPGPDRCPLAD